MSGGYFDYAQYHIDDIIAKIERMIDDAEKPKPPIVTKVGISVKLVVEKGHYHYINMHFDTFDDAIRHFALNENYKILEQNRNRMLVKGIYTGDLFEITQYTYEEYEDGGDYPEYSDETIAELKCGVDILKQASVYVQRIDWLFSCDDGEDNFHKRLKQDLDKIKNK